MRRMTLIAIVLLVLGIAGGSVVARGQPEAPAPQADACPHGIDRAKCPFCDPSRVERLGTCREHGVPEALCVKCKPLLKTAFLAAGDWCKEHDTPESQCLACNPELAKAAMDKARQAREPARWTREPSVDCTTSKTPVQVKTLDALKAAGLEYVQVKAAPLTRSVERNAELAYDANRYARLSARAPGAVAEVRKDLGAVVKRGDVLVVVESTELGAAKSALLEALATVGLWTANAARERGLVEKGVGIEREALEAETRLAEGRIGANRARQRLRTLGLSKEQVDAVEKDNETSPLLEILAPFDGTVVERSAIVGDPTEPAKPLLTVADTSTMWAMVDLTEADLSLVRADQPAVFRSDGMPGRLFPGRVAWVSTQVDSKSRTIKARIEVANAEGALKANMFGRAAVTAGGSPRAVVIPKSAVQWEGCCNVAFVKTGSDGLTFQPTRLTLGFDTGDGYEVLGGLKAGDTIVGRGSFVLKNELLKSSVGGGCCDVGHLDK